MSPTELDLGMRRRIGGAIRRNLGADGEDLGEYAVGRGDPGLFGPGSPVWSVHGDLPAMLIGGFAALMTQTLHPLAMAGVAAHSNYREDPTGRLRRTARFIAGTTFGGTAFAEQLVAEVRRVHQRVHGVAPDGRRYAASDPDLLTFVHVSEVASFLASYQRYGRRPLLRIEKDRYLDEIAVVAEMLGATGVPRSVAALRRYQSQIIPELARTPQASDALSFLERSTS
ncbi:MAG TPA: oxygenase MpaB family protein, partial [Acidimicrobiales bacterium]|nr:oxygenase MpaB family protein [Acidimicrobiales bacterium]